MRRRRWVSMGTVVGLAAFLPLVGGPPAQAGEGGANLALSVTASLPESPCPADDPDALPCSDGALGGVVSGELSGRTTDGEAWSVVIVDATVSGTFSYADGPACTTGRAAGSLTVTADDLHAEGVFEDSPLPRPIPGVTVVADFSWDQVGNTVEIALRDAVVDVDVAGLGTIEVVSTGQGEAAGTFTREPADALDCASGSGSGATAAIEADGTITEDRLPSTPTLLVPEDGVEFDFGEPARFTVNATDPDGEPYRALITVVDAVTAEVVATFETHLAPSGVDVSGRPDEPIPVGFDYEWFAEAIDIRGGKGPASEPRTFDVEAAGPESSGSSLLPGLPVLE